VNERGGLKCLARPFTTQVRCGHAPQLRVHRRCGFIDLCATGTRCTHGL